MKKSVILQALDIGFMLGMFWSVYFMPEFITDKIQLFVILGAYGLIFGTYWYFKFNKYLERKYFFVLNVLGIFSGIGVGIILFALEAEINQNTNHKILFLSFACALMVPFVAGYIKLGSEKKGDT